VEIIPKIVCASRTTMSIKYAKEADLRPFNIKVSFIFGFQDIKDYANSVLVVISDNSLVCIGSV